MLFILCQIKPLRLVQKFEFVSFFHKFPLMGRLQGKVFLIHSQVVILIMHPIFLCNFLVEIPVVESPYCIRLLSCCFLAFFKMSTRALSKFTIRTFFLFVEPISCLWVALLWRTLLRTVRYCSSRLMSFQAGPATSLSLNSVK